jgi:hypothetical protein
LNDVNNAVRNARLLQKVKKDLHGTRDLLRGLHHVGVAEGDGQGEHPQRAHGREVEGSDTSADAERHTVAVEIDALGHVAEGLALGKGGEAGGVLNDLEATEDVALGVDETLAVLLGDDLSDLVLLNRFVKRYLYLVLLEELLVLEHVPHSRRDGHLLPGLEGLLRVGHGRIELRLRALRHLADQLLGRLC